MAATPKPKTLYFVHPIYARGEHIIGKNAKDKDGKINMIRIARGEKHEVDADAANDLIIAKQAIDFRNAKPEELEEAQAYVEERNALEQRENTKKKAA